jgi:hypothetical protein
MWGTIACVYFHLACPHYYHNDDYDNDKYDWVLMGGDDMYVAVDNLRYYLSAN